MWCSALQAQVLLWGTELLGGFPFLPSRETWLLPWESQEWKQPGLCVLP